jgi:hypothetical protein
VVTPLHLAYLDLLASCNSLGKKGSPWHPTLSWVFALRAHANTYSVERRGIRHAHQTTVTAALIDKLLHLTSPKS